MSMAGRCIAASTASGMFVGPGMLRNSRPLETVMASILSPCRSQCWPIDESRRLDDARFVSTARLGLAITNSRVVRWLAYVLAGSAVLLLLVIIGFRTAAAVRERVDRT